MPDFDITNYGEDHVNIRVYPSAPYTAYRVLVREESSASAIVYDEWFTDIAFTFDAFVDGLEPGTAYLANVAYHTVPQASGSQWIGAQSFTTDGGGGGETPAVYYATLYFDANGGSGAPGYVDGEAEDEEYVSITIPTREPTRNSYLFDGWSLDRDAESADYYPGRSYSWWGSQSGEAYTLYAVWVQEETTSVNIGNGYTFDGAAPHIWTGGTWRRATAYVWSGGTWKRGT